MYLGWKNFVFRLYLKFAFPPDFNATRSLAHQQKILKKIIGQLADTQLGKDLQLKSDFSYEQFIETVISKAITYLNEQRSQKNGIMYRSILEWVDDIIAGLKNKESWKRTVNEKVMSVIGDIINRNHHLIGEMVEKNLTALSPEQIKEQFRSRTYDDMQWIRVNGAVAGFAIGIAIGIVRVIWS